MLIQRLSGNCFRSRQAPPYPLTSSKVIGPVPFTEQWGQVSLPLTGPPRCPPLRANQGVEPSTRETTDRHRPSIPLVNILLHLS